MNPKQRILTLIALAVFVSTLIYAPWVIREHGRVIAGTEYQLMWFPPAGGTLAFHNLFVEWIALGVVYGGMWAVLRDRPASK